MIRKLVDFALNNRFVVIVTAILVLIAGGLSFHDMPVEAYPDIADNYVNIITQWPGRSAEEVEQQVSVPIESRWEDSRISRPCAPSRFLDSRS